MVDLIHHQMPVARLDRGGQARQFVAAEHGTGGVRRGRHQGADAVLVPVALHQVRSQLVTHIGADRDQLRGAFHQAQEMPVARIAGVRQQPVLAGVHQQAAGQQQGTGTTGSDHDPLGIDVQAITLPVETGDRHAQLGNATSRGVAGLAGTQGRLAGLDDRCCGGEVRFADLQVDHIVSGGLQFVGPGQQGHDMERFDSATARTVGQSHWPSFIQGEQKPDSTHALKIGRTQACPSALFLA